MYWVSVHNHNTEVEDHKRLEIGSQYLMGDIEAGMALSDLACEAKATAVEQGEFEETFDPEKHKTVLFLFHGCIGDTIFLEPVFRKINEIYPSIYLVPITGKPNFGVLDNEPSVSIQVPYPIPRNGIHKGDFLVDLSKCFHPATEGVNELHPTDLYIRLLKSKGFNIELTDEEKRPKYHITEEEKAWAEEQYPRNKKKRLGVQMVASGKYRTYKPQLTCDSIIPLALDGWECFLFGTPKSFNITIKEIVKDRVIDLSEKKYSIRETAAIMSTCDVFLGQDSGLTHLAGALNIPTVAVYAAYPWQIRTKYHPKCYSIQANASCSPCFHYTKYPKGDFPFNKPCYDIRECIALNEIEPKRITTKIKKQYETYYL